MSSRTFTRLSPLLACLLILTACQGDSLADDGTRIPRLRSSKAIYLVDPFTQQLVSYHRTKHRVIARSSEDNYVYYGFSPPTDLFTAGNSITLGFSLLQISDRDVTTLAEAPENQGYFPLASSGPDVFLIRVTYDSQSAPLSHSIVLREPSGNLSEYFDVDGVPDSGAIVDGWLYYSVFNLETELFDVYSFQIGNYSLDPKLERSGLESGQIYAHKGKVLYAENDAVQSGGVSFPCSDLCYFYDTPDVAVKIAPNDEGYLELTVFDGTTGEVLGTAEGVVGFAANDNGVLAFGEGFEELIRASS